MNRKILIMALIALLIGLFVQSSGLLAQDVTPEPTPVVVVEPPGTEPVAEPFNFWGWLSANSAIVIAAFFGGAMVWQSNQHRKTLKDVLEHADKRSVDAIEAAHDALPDSAQLLLDRALGIGENLAEQFTAVLAFLRKVSDGKPNDPPPAAEG